MQQDPYAVVEVTNSTKEQTKEDKGGGQHPGTSVLLPAPRVDMRVKANADSRDVMETTVWDEQFVIPVYEVEGEPVQKLKIQVFAKEPKKDPLLGEGEIIIHPQAAKQWENNQFDGEWRWRGCGPRARATVRRSRARVGRRWLIVWVPADWIELNDAGKCTSGPFLSLIPTDLALPRPDRGEVVRRSFHCRHFPPLTKSAFPVPRDDLVPSSRPPSREPPSVLGKLRR